MKYRHRPIEVDAIQFDGMPSQKEMFCLVAYLDVQLVL